MLAVTNQGGSALANMEVWTIAWRGDEALGARVDAFNGSVVASPYWHDSLAEYGVSGGTAKGLIVLGAPPAAVDDNFFEEQVPQLLGKTTTTGATFTAPSASTVVTFLIPKATTEPVGTSYHTETEGTVASAAGGPIHIPYIVLDQIAVGFIPDFDYLTWSQSHELAEAATDPLPDYDPAWYNVDVDIQGEIADLCNDIPSKVVLGGTTTTVNRLYSAKLAAARKGDPCVPPLPGPYGNIALSPLNLHIPAGTGKSGTLHLTAFTFGSPAPVHFQLYGDPSYTMTPSSGMIAPGLGVDVTVTRNAASPPDPTDMNVWMNSPGDPNAYIPLAESFSAITVGP
jgi:hypothetical protein